MLEEKVKPLKKPRGSKYNRTIEWLEKHDHSDGQYIANINTKILHQPDCRHVKRMLIENQLITDNIKALYRPCAHCTPDKNSTQTLLQLSNLQKRSIPCKDPSILQLFKTGCKIHGTLHRQIKMYPDNKYGTKITGQPGKWHLYYHCTICKTNTPIHIAQTKKIGEKLKCY